VAVTCAEFEVFEPYEIPRPNVYDVIPDSSNNGYFLVMGAEEVGRIDAKTGAIEIFKTPTRNSGPRRGMMDAHDRLWFGENRSDSIGMFDTRTRRFQEWKPPTPGTWPYDVTADRNGEVWSGGVQRSHPSPRSTNQSIHRVLAAGPHQRAARLRGQLDRPGHLLGGQQPRRVDREARAARHVDANVETMSVPRSTVVDENESDANSPLPCSRHPFRGYLATGLTTTFPSSFFITSPDTASFNFASSSPL
jgi:hypothetical protein